MEKQVQQRQDIEFTKWLKQRENLGIDDLDDDIISTSTVNRAKQTLNSKKDRQTKEIQELDKQNKELEKLGKIKFDDTKNFSKNIDPSETTAEKIRELIQKMDLGDNLQASESEIFKHLQNSQGNKNRSRLSVSQK